MSPQLNAGNMEQGLRSLRDLTQHLTTRADDSHAPPVKVSRRKTVFPRLSPTCQAQVRFFALRPYSPGGALIALASAREESTPPTPSAHRLRRGLPGYLILFAPHAFAPQRQYRPSELPSLLVFLLISAHSTATPGIPLASSGL